MKKVGIFVLLISLFTCGIAMPFDDDEQEQCASEWMEKDEAFAEDLFSYEEELEEERVAPRPSLKDKRSRNVSQNNALPKAPLSRKASEKHSATVRNRSEMKDPREHSNRPRVVHRGHQKQPLPADQMEADAQEQEHLQEGGEEQLRTDPSKGKNTSAASEKGAVKSRSGSRSGTAQRKLLKKGLQNRVKSHAGSNSSVRH